jgi:hypothetical protein
MGHEQERAATEVERLTKLRDHAAAGSAEHRELNHLLIKARRRLYETEWRKRQWGATPEGVYLGDVPGVVAAAEGAGGGRQPCPVATHHFAFVSTG